MSSPAGAGTLVTSLAPRPHSPTYFRTDCVSKDPTTSGHCAPATSSHIGVGWLAIPLVPSPRWPPYCPIEKG
jgi:hypothetical protein